MHALRWRPQILIDSTVQSAAQFSTSTARPRVVSAATKRRSSGGNQGRNERGKFRPDFERERSDGRDQRDNILQNFDRTRRSNGAPGKGDEEGSLDRRPKSWGWRAPPPLFTFSPSAGGNIFRPGARTGADRKTRGSGADKQSMDELLPEWMNELEQNMHKDTVFKTLGMEKDELDDAFDVWSTGVLEGIGQRPSKNAGDYQRFKEIFPTVDASVMKLYIKYSFYGHIINKGQSVEELQDHKDLADLSYPTEWFPATRGFQREFHLHVGPTNSGKTYHALKRLEQAETGLYAGPLRLLAHEVFMRLNANGSRCNLVTGDDRRASDEDPNAPMTSCTVEMIPLNVKLGVAVIDEIQMIGSLDRGWAWTQAVLGVMANEVHCCGEERAVPIMQELVAMCGEKLHVHRYKRLSPLQMSRSPLNGSLKKLQKGDCIVAFSVVEIHALRQEIEKVKNVKVAVIYGSLPPETRAQQAKLFNDPDSGYDILVASNAIGMGLNLSIKRMVFVTTTKFDGAKWSTIPVAEGKQIAGRAGRYSTAAQDIKRTAASNLDLAQPIPLQIEVAASSHRVHPPSNNIGYVTTLDAMDYPILERIMASEPEPLVSAGIQPPSYIVERFARQFPASTPFAYLLMRLHELGRTNSRFFQCELRQGLSIADVLEGIEGLSITDRIIFCSSPIEPRKPGEPELGRAYARLVAESKAARIVDIEQLDFDLLRDDYEATRPYLQKLEGLHKAVIIWNWLSYRFSGVFMDRPLADYVKGLVEARIEETLQRLSFNYKKLRASRARALEAQQLAESLAAEREPSQMYVDSAAGHDQVHRGEQDELEDDSDVDDPMLDIGDLDDIEQDALEQQFRKIESSEEVTPPAGPARTEPAACTGGKVAH